MLTVAPDALVKLLWMLLGFPEVPLLLEFPELPLLLDFPAFEEEAFLRQGQV